MRAYSMRLWFYNNVQRHLFNLKLAVLWRVAGRPGRPPYSGKITPEALEWADECVRDLDGM